jgi:hypothetical protein
MPTEGLHDTPPNGRKRGRISIVGPFAAGAPSWSYKDSSDYSRNDAIEEAEGWLFQKSRARHKTCPDSLERLHVLLNDLDLEEKQPIRAALKACEDPTALFFNKDGYDDAGWPGTALHSAIMDRGDAIAAKLLEVLLSDPRVQAAVDKPDAHGWTTLAWCVTRSDSHPESVRVLLAHAADPNQVVPLFRDHPELAGRSVIAEALRRAAISRRGWLIYARILLAAGANPPTVPDHRAIALGAGTGYMPWIEQGIGAGVDVNATAPAVFGEAITPLVVAVSIGDLPMTRALLTAGARWRFSKFPILFEAIEQRWREKMGHAPDAVSPERSVLDMVKLLIKHKVDADVVHEEKSAFDALAENLNLRNTPGLVLKLALLLKKAGANPTASTLRRAVDNSPNLEIVEALLAVGCDPNEVDHSAPEPISAANYVRKKLRKRITDQRDADRFAAVMALFDERDLKSVPGPDKSKAAKPKRIM